jgi:hypothetical protein
MAKHTYNCIDALRTISIDYDDAVALRRISMTLHRWHELECGNSDSYKSYSVARGSRKKVAPGKYEFTYDDTGKPYMETHYNDSINAMYHPIPDRERGALKRLAKIMAKYPTLQSYVQGDPRGASLYILRPGDVPEGASVDSCYSRGVGVCK